MQVISLLRAREKQSTREDRGVRESGARQPRLLQSFGFALLAASLVPTAVSGADFERLPPGVEALRFEVLATVPHDPGAFTQGLIWSPGQAGPRVSSPAGPRLYESTGLYNGRSSLRRLDPKTGAVTGGLKLSPELFAEGLARVDARLIQLTWKAGLAIEYNIDTLRPTGRTHRYDGEGWGLCYDGALLWMSNGSDTLTGRDPKSFEAVRSLPVSLGSKAVQRLNELECVGESIYANVWQTDYIVRIEKRTGRVSGVLDARQLFTARTASHDVLNGIAYRQDQGTFYLTGKLWPLIYEVRITADGG